MNTVRAIFGYTMAILTIPILLAALIGSAFWSELLVSVTGVTVSPWETGGEVVRTIAHGDYHTEIHQTVFGALIGERKEGFVQIAWSPRENVPAQVDEEIDFDDDGTLDFRVELDTHNKQAVITPYTEQVLGLQGVYRPEEAWVVRVRLSNNR